MLPQTITLTKTVVVPFESCRSERCSPFRWPDYSESGQQALRDGGAGAVAALCLWFCWRVARRRAGRRRLQAGGPRHA